VFGFVPRFPHARTGLGGTAGDDPRMGPGYVVRKGVARVEVSKNGMLDVRDCASFQHGVSLLVIWLDGWLTLLDNVHIHTETALPS
jgi:hypothetical protein